MRRLVQGIVEFRKNRRPDYAETFARLALRQKPDALYIACSDSRVQANVFASIEPGDLFVVRNPGNLVSPADADGKSLSDESEAAAIEFALDVLEVRDIIVCGHSGCGAMAALAAGRENVRWPHLRSWLRHGDAAAERLRQGDGDPERTPQDRLSQLNVLLTSIDRALLDPRGLPGRPWYRSFIYAPGLMTGYGVKTLPAVREAIQLCSEVRMCGGRLI